MQLSLLTKFLNANYKSSPMLHINLNLSPLFDVVNGSYYKGVDGRWYLNGGVTDNNAIVGGNNTQKTGRIIFEATRFLRRFHRGVVLYNDTESTLDISRLARGVDKAFGQEGYFFEHIFNKRFIYKTKKDEFDGASFHELVQALYENFNDNKKNMTDDDYLTTVFPDDKGEPTKVPYPMMIVCDSLTEQRFNRIIKNFTEGSIDEGGKQNTRDMRIGNMKRILFEDVSDWGAIIGAKIYWVGQVQDIINMDGKPLEKASVFIRQGKKIAKCPRAILNQPHWGFEIIRGAALKDGNQEWLYPNPNGKDTVLVDGKENPDLLYYSYSMFRNKGGNSGIQLGFIGSQSEGIQEGLSMYHILKGYDYYGLEGSKISHSCVLLPDVKLGRTTCRSKINEDHRLYRALTICYQMWFAQSFVITTPQRFLITPQELYQKIIERGYSWEKILSNTVDYWHDDPTETRLSLSTRELIAIAIGESDWDELKK